MADLRDVHGNPIQLTDEHGNPVQLTDEHGNPVHVSGVATTHTEQLQTQMGYDISAAYDAQPQQQLYYKQPFPEAQRVHYEVSNTTREEILRSNTSSSSSSEDDVMCGRRKKKGLKEKIKEKLTGGKHKVAEAGKESQTVTYVAKTSVTTTTSDAMSPPEHHHHHGQHQKKSMTVKIKEKLPGHHSH